MQRRGRYRLAPCRSTTPIRFRLAPRSVRTRSMPLADRSPLDFAPLEPVVPTEAADVPQIIAEARRAQEAWAMTPLQERIEILYKAKDRILDRGDVLATLLRAECGK